MTQNKAMCFICFGDEQPLLGSCLCATVAHKECLEKMIATVPAHAKVCAVCQTPYNTTSSVTEKCVWVSNCYLLLSSYVLVICSWSLMLVLHSLGYLSKNPFLLGFLTFNVTITTLGCGCIQGVFHRQTGHCLCWRRERVVREVSLVSYVPSDVV